MKIIYTYICILILFNYTAKSNEIINRCGTDAVIQQDFKNHPIIHDAYLRQINNAVNSISAYDTARANTDSIYTVQVVVHIVYLNDNKYENIPDDIVRSQIDALNRDYNLLNEDTANLRSIFKPFQGNAKIKFELATKTPSGTPTNGITRTKGQLGTLTGWSPLSNPLLYALNIEAVKSDYLPGVDSKGKTSWNTAKYINIWVCDLNVENRKCKTCLNVCDTCGTLLGIATPPSNAINWGPLALEKGANDGIIIDFRGFGQRNWFARDSASHRFLEFYAKGRTPVHEVGHYLGLQHTWGNVIPVLTPDGCAVDDFIDDTPEELQAFAANLVKGTLNPCDTSINTCTKTYLGVDFPDMFENYMDYSTDLCYNLFTKQQVNLMRYNLLTRRTGLITKREVAPNITTSLKYNSTNINGITVYPNPATAQLNIQLDKPFSYDVQLDIVDLKGTLVYSNNIYHGNTNYTINISQLPAAMYLLRITENGSMKYLKFMKQE